MRKRYLFSTERTLRVAVRSETGAYVGAVSGQYLIDAPDVFVIEDVAISGEHAEGSLLCRALFELLLAAKARRVEWPYEIPGDADAGEPDCDPRLRVLRAAAQFLSGYETERIWYGDDYRVEMADALAHAAARERAERYFPETELARDGYSFASFAEAGSLAAELPTLCAGEATAARFFPASMGAFDPAMAFFILKDGEAAGWIYLHEDKETLCFSRFYVREKYRAEKIGPKLMLHLARTLLLPGRYRSFCFLAKEDTASILRVVSRLVGAADLWNIDAEIRPEVEADTALFHFPNEEAPDKMIPVELDSMDYMDMLLMLEDDYGIKDLDQSEIDHLMTVREVAALIEAKGAAKQ